jgi:repressor LexA
MPRQAQLTVRQEQVLVFMQNRQRETGLVPTLQETANHFGFKSPNAVRQHLRLIEKKGMVHRLPGRSRGLVLPQPEYSGDSEFVRIPLVGRIPAGLPAVAKEDAESFLTLPAHIFRGRRLFALRVHGTSMSGAGILDGDIAVFDAVPEVRNGTIAAVLIEDDATLKRVYRTPNGLTLKAENRLFPDMKIAAIEAQRVRILGPLVGILRRV